MLLLGLLGRREGGGSGWPSGKQQPLGGTPHWSRGIVGGGISGNQTLCIDPQLSFTSPLPPHTAQGGRRGGIKVSLGRLGERKAVSVLSLFSPCYSIFKW